MSAATTGRASHESKIDHVCIFNLGLLTSNFPLCVLQRLSVRGSLQSGGGDLIRALLQQRRPCCKPVMLTSIGTRNRFFSSVRNKISGLVNGASNGTAFRLVSSLQHVVLSESRTHTHKLSTHTLSLSRAHTLARRETHAHTHPHTSWVGR